MDQQIVFRINEQLFAVPITATDKIIQLDQITKVPDSSAYVMGVTDVEGRVLPVIDLPNRLYNQTLENAEDAQILIVYWKETKIGLAVDEVQAVQTYQPEQIDREFTNVSSNEQAASPISSFIRTENGIVLALEIDQLFAETGTLELQQLMDIHTEAVTAGSSHAE